MIQNFAIWLIIKFMIIIHSKGGYYEHWLVVINPTENYPQRIATLTMALGR